MGKLRLYLAILCAAFLISACAQKEPVIEILPQATEVTLPPAARTCSLVPPPPNPDTATQRDVAAWIPDVYAAHAECRSDLRTVVRVVDGHNAEARRQAEENANLIED